VARLRIDEADLVQARQRIRKLAFPLKSAVAGEQDDADRAHAVRQLVATHDPPDLGRQKVYGPQRRAQPGPLARPRFATVERVQDDAFIPDRPAFLGIEEE